MSSADGFLSSAQAWLLIAALAEGAQAREAWLEWERLSNWQEKQIDPGSYRLLSLVYRNMARASPQDPSISRLKGIYRKVWFENARLWRLTAPAVGALATAGIPVMLVKGASLTALYYRDRAARAMVDVDIVVPQARALEAAALLGDQGWRSNERASAARLLQYHHSAPLVHASGGRIDLHRYVLAENSGIDADGPVWKAARTMEFEGVQVCAPRPEDELLIACIHGWRWNVIPSIRWIADVVTILRVTPEFTWGCVVSEARRRHLGYRASRALRFASTYTAAIPGSVLADLDQGPFESFEVGEEKLLNRRPGLIPPTSIQAAYKFNRLHGRPRTLAEWIRFVRYMLAVGTALAGPHAPFWFLELLGRRLSRTFGRRG